MGLKNKNKYESQLGWQGSRPILSRANILNKQVIKHLSKVIVNGKIGHLNSKLHLNWGIIIQSLNKSWSVIFMFLFLLTSASLHICL